MAKIQLTSEGGYTGIVDGEIVKIEPGDVVEVSDAAAAYLLGDDSPCEFALIEGDLSGHVIVKHAPAKPHDPDLVGRIVDAHRKCHEARLAVVSAKAVHEQALADQKVADGAGAAGDKKGAAKAVKEAAKAVKEAAKALADAEGDLAAAERALEDLEALEA